MSSNGYGPVFKAIMLLAIIGFFASIGLIAWGMYSILSFVF